MTPAETVLAALVALKDGPRDERYYATKPIVWAQARAIVAEVAVRESVTDALLPPVEPTGEPVPFPAVHATWCDGTLPPHEAPWCPPVADSSGGY